MNPIDPDTRVAGLDSRGLENNCVGHPGGKGAARVDGATRDFSRCRDDTGACSPFAVSKADQLRGQRKTDELSACSARSAVADSCSRRTFPIDCAFQPRSAPLGFDDLDGLLLGRTVCDQHDRQFGVGVVRVKSHADVFEEYRNHAEPKSTGPDGEPRGRATSGGLGRRPVFGMYPIYIGKESNRLEEVEQGTVHDWDEVRSEYPDPFADQWKLLVVPILKMMNGPDLARRAGITERHVARLRNGRQMPSAELRELLTRIAAEHARSHLGSDTPVDDLAACALYLQQADANLSGTDRH